MAKSAEVDDPSRDAVPGPTTPARREKLNADRLGIPPLKTYSRRPDVTEELQRWYSLGDAERLEELNRATAGERRWSFEALLHVARLAYAEGDRVAYFRAFNAFATRATPLLYSQARAQRLDEPEDHVQDVLLIAARDIQAGKADYAEAYFADYTLRKAIDARRRKDATLEAKLVREEPTRAPEDGQIIDPLDEVADRVPSPEARALLHRGVGKLEGRLREVFIQYHVERRTYAEIADHYEMDETTVSNWVKQAERLVGYQGGNDDHEE